MKKVISTLWGLVVDDARLAWTLVVALLIAAVMAYILHLAFIAAVVIWLGLILSLVLSVEHQLKLRMK
ncbi:hypothetical protein [Alicyclobacillus sp. SO9]|uniref:hypothetical protein n=1 Tax=Alicyclobacillus sp. SO9 TaxID=2665646 RepID=UPI0018E8373C|nr:hypothetical protein [Alicyclobacillus sp. SO9]QQE77591.1 hypothetical protein GI364_16820 [Alicyclobacillus sp. SO9]